MVLSYVDCKWIQLLRVDFGCTKSRVREILIDVYPNYGLQIHTPDDLISYASLMLGVNIEQQCEERWESMNEERDSKQEEQSIDEEKLALQKFDEWFNGLYGEYSTRSEWFRSTCKLEDSVDRTRMLSDWVKWAFVSGFRSSKK